MENPGGNNVHIVIDKYVGSRSSQMKNIPFRCCFWGMLNGSYDATKIEINCFDSHFGWRMNINDNERQTQYLKLFFQLNSFQSA